MLNRRNQIAPEKEIAPAAVMGKCLECCGLKQKNHPKVVSVIN